MHSWEVVCIDVDEDSEYDDCRAIREIGYLGPTLKRKSANTAAAQIRQGHSRFHFEDDGERVTLQGATDPDVHFYVKSTDADSPDDPLLELVACKQYEMDERFGGTS